nr:MAG TPA: hypothetical protein [Caudoviricetes sp.]
MEVSTSNGNIVSLLVLFVKSNKVHMSFRGVDACIGSLFFVLVNDCWAV